MTTLTHDEVRKLRREISGRRIAGILSTGATIQDL